MRAHHRRRRVIDRTLRKPSASIANALPTNRWHVQGSFGVKTLQLEGTLLTLLDSHVRYVRVNWGSQSRNDMREIDDAGRAWAELHETLFDARPEAQLENLPELKSARPGLPSAPLAVPTGRRRA